LIAITTSLPFETNIGLMDNRHSLAVSPSIMRPPVNCCNRRLQSRSRGEHSGCASGHSPAPATIHFHVFHAHGIL